MKNFRLLAALLMFSTASVFANKGLLITKILAEREVARNCTDKHLADWHKSTRWIMNAPRLTHDLPDWSPEFLTCGDALRNLIFAEKALHEAQTTL